ncbi:unnamed protein product [Acanthoscelides obtectus]|uniref:Uncharacterized protein n=1 Tax=Acanthoscelides obtectus TaxID=200917 RepID=A0A9P0QHD2_ACAOB|nr:unnamed protein product [Acanthoscelides obtectus]CAK1683432.1 Ankyrin repeat domain-containing protein 6 [Acanthoscelides obtectus]
MSCGRPSGGVSATAASTAAQQQLRHAAFAGDAATCRRLLAGAQCVRFSRDQRGRSALHLAAAAGRATVVRLLLAVAAPGEADAPDGDGCAPLQTAAADGHEEVVRLLLARGADVDGCDSVHNNTALHEAAWKGYSRTVRLLAAAGANLTKANAGGFTALHLCCQNGHNQYGHAGVTRILISGQCRVSEQNKNGDTALHIAAAMGRRKLTRILLEAGCDKCVRNKQGETARDIALRKELTEIVDIVDECVARREKKANKQKKRSKSKVRFESKHGKYSLCCDTAVLGSTASECRANALLKVIDLPGIHCLLFLDTVLIETRLMD